MPTIDPKYLSDEAAAKAMGFCMTTGLTMGRAGGGWTNCPVMVRASPFPREQLKKGKDLARGFNLVVDRAARDTKFVVSELEKTGEADEFTGKLLGVYKSVYVEGKPAQEFMLGIHRSDYMLDTTTNCIKQIEINTIASAFAGLSPITNALHNYLRRNLGVEGADPVPVSESDVEIPAAMAAAVAASGVSGGCALFVVQEGERNASDQRILEQNLFKTHGIVTLRKSLTEISKEASLDSSGCLTVSGQPIGLVYFRAGYTPDDFKTESCWEARRILEKSTAVKCPSAGYQLVGAKKIQQVLCDKTVLSRFCPPEDLDAVMSVFADMSGLEDTPANAAVIESAIATPDDWLLKPQREGGGSLIHGDAMVKLLKDLQPSQRGEFILMKKIRPPEHQSAVLRDDVLHEDSFISELGVYGVFLGDGKGSETVNKCAGHLLRSKPANQPDGGVAAGVAALDSPDLY